MEEKVETLIEEEKKEIEETKPEELKIQEKPEEIKRKSNFRKWLKGENKKEYIENISFIIIVISGILVSLGIVLGSFIQGTILMASLGSFFVMAGIIIYIISQFIEG